MGIHAIVFLIFGYENRFCQIRAHTVDFYEINTYSLALIVGILLATVSGMEPTYDNIMQQPDVIGVVIGVLTVFMIIAMEIMFVIALVVVGVAYIFPDRKLVKDSLRDMLNFLRGNPPIFLIGFITSIILFPITIGIDMIAPVPPSTYMYGADPMDVMGGEFASLMAFSALSLIITGLISIYFTAVSYCFIKKPQIGEAFSDGVKFYFRLLRLTILTTILVIFLVILMFIIFFIVVLIAGTAASISLLIGGILFAILLILIYIAATLTFLAVMLRLAFAVPILIYENGGVVDSLRESWNRTQGALLSIFVVNSIAGIIWMLPPMIILMLLPQSVIGHYLYSFLMYLLIPISCVASAMLYFNVSKNKRGVVKKGQVATPAPAKPEQPKSKIPIREPPKYVG